MKLTLKEFLEKVNNGKVDVTRTVHNDLEFVVFDVFGTKYEASTADGLLFNLENLTRTPLPTWSYHKPHWVKGEVVVDVEDKCFTNRSEQIQAETEVAEPLITLEPTVEKKEVKWDWIDTLRNEKDDKEALDIYAEKELGIKLNRRKTLSNMIASLKEQLGE